MSELGESGAGTLRDRAIEFAANCYMTQKVLHSQNLEDFARSERNAALRRCAEIARLPRPCRHTLSCFCQECRDNIVTSPEIASAIEKLKGE